jgi:hypothetical protein
VERQKHTKGPPTQGQGSLRAGAVRRARDAPRCPLQPSQGSARTRARRRSRQLALRLASPPRPPSSEPASALSFHLSQPAHPFSPRSTAQRRGVRSARLAAASQALVAPRQPRASALDYLLHAFAASTPAARACYEHRPFTEATRPQGLSHLSLGLRPLASSVASRFASLASCSELDRCSLAQAEETLQSAFASVCTVLHAGPHLSTLFRAASPK